MSQGFCRISGKRFNIDLAVCHKVAAKIFIIHRYCNTGDDSFEAVNNLLDLTKLDSETAKLDLIVNSSEKFDLAIWSDLCKIACFIGSFSVESDENFCCFLRQIDVATTYSKTCNYKLSGLSVRKDPVLFVNHINLNIAVWLSDGNVFAVGDYLHGTADGSLGWSIAVHNISIRVYCVNLVKKCRRECFCSYVKYLDLGSCFLKLGQIDHIGKIGRSCGHNIHFIFYN